MISKPILPPSRRRAGFTLLELLVVLAILALLIGLVAPAALRQLGGAKQKIAHLNIEQLVSQLDTYKLDVGSYPTTDQGLQALIAQPEDVTGWNGPYLKSASGLNDPWGHPYHYRNPSNRAGHVFDIFTLGADNQPGGSGEDADVYNE